MKHLSFTLILAVIFSISDFAQDTESYTALKVTGDNVPVIDGTIDDVWENVEIVPLTKVPEVGGVVHENITVPNPDPSDYYAEFGILWNDTGMFFLFSVTDDQIVILEDYTLDNGVPADHWWVDDNINLLFSKDLEYIVWEQWEFAWQPGIDQEEKLSSDDWLNAALIDIDQVQSAWYNDGNLWILETFIYWTAFANGYPLITPDMDIFLEARARDDDDLFEGSSWETMFQWSTTNYEVENTGEGMGTVTLSSTEVEGVGISEIQSESGNMRVYPNPSRGISELQMDLRYPSDVNIGVSDLSGKRLRELQFTGLSSGEQRLSLDLSELPQGVYFLQVGAGDAHSVLKYVRQ